ncbi:MAG: hypothetical protein R3321_02395, partial [Nitrososphaeraceae archaeon]|nr:hypothetical protein [Nitrososphaeraceae archaeon]
MHQIQIIHTDGKSSVYKESTNWDAVYQFMLEQILSSNNRLEGRNGAYYKAITNTVIDLRVSF